MIIRTAFLILCLITGSVAIADNKGGLGAYGALASKWPCEAMMEGFKDVRELRLSVLWYTFGTNLSCLDKWASDPRPKMLQVHLINEVCHRNNRCGDYEVFKKLSLEQYRNKLKARDEALLARIRTNILPVADWYARNPSVQCRLTGGLESNLDKSAYIALTDSLKPLFPDRCKWVWNPVNNNRFNRGPIPGFIHELHGDDSEIKSPCIVNMDGVDADLPVRPAIVAPKIAYSELPRFLASSASCEAKFLWIAEFNGIGRGSFIDPRKRTNWPTSKIMNQLNKQIVFHVEPAPPWDAEADKAKEGCQTFLKVPDGSKRNFLWKQSEPAVLGRGAVAFLPTSYNKRSIDTQKVYVMKGSKKIATAYEKSRYTEDGSNRQFFRFKKLAKDFPYNVVVHYGNICAVVENPKIRVD